MYLLLGMQNHSVISDSIVIIKVKNNLQFKLILTMIRLAKTLFMKMIHLIC